MEPGTNNTEGHRKIERANVQGAHIENAYLQGPDLRGAYLQGAELGRARGLIKEQIEQAYGDENTKLPEGLQLPAAWHHLASQRYTALVEKGARNVG